MPKRRTLAYYRSLYGTMEILPDAAAEIPSILRRIALCRPEYTAATAATRTHWHILAIIHMLEASGSLLRNLFNGQDIGLTTTIRPKGLGPWPDWPSMAAQWLQTHALRFEAREPTTSPSKILQWLESYNGWGYARRDKHSPYIWSGAQHGIGQGKFTSDGRYDPAAVSKQIGAAPLLRALQNCQPGD